MHQEYSLCYLFLIIVLHMTSLPLSLPLSFSTHTITNIYRYILPGSTISEGACLMVIYGPDKCNLTEVIIWLICVTREMFRWTGNLMDRFLRWAIPLINSKLTAIWQINSLWYLFNQETETTFGIHFILTSYSTHLKSLNGEYFGDTKSNDWYSSSE